MRVVVITGGLGAGKSTAAEFMRERGAVVIDADKIAEQLLQPGSPVLARVAEEFGDDVLLADGRLDRPALARAAFASAEKTALLNRLVHPAVAREIGPAMAELRLLPEPPEIVVLEVPLLAEAPVYAELGDVVLAIVAPVEARVGRAVAAGLDEADARRRVARQATDAERAALATDVLVNDRDRESFLAALRSFWDERVAVEGSR